MKAGAAPFEFVVMKYREKFGLTWQEYLDTPPEVFYTDIEMMTIENEQEKIHQDKVQSGRAK